MIDGQSEAAEVNSRRCCNERIAELQTILRHRKYVSDLGWGKWLTLRDELERLLSE